MAGSGTSSAAETTERVGTSTTWPGRSRPLLSVVTFGLYHLSWRDVRPAFDAMDASVSPFFASTRVYAVRAAGSIAANAESNPAAYPTGTRARNRPPGGVTPRSTCEFSSRIESSGAPLAFAIATSGVEAGTYTESYASGGTVRSFMP